MKKVYAIALLCFVMTIAGAQQPQRPAQQQIPKDVLEGIANDLASLDALIHGAQTPQEPSLSWGSTPATVTVTKDTTAKLGASEDAGVAWKVNKGEDLHVIDKVSDYYAVMRPVSGQRGGRGIY